jgi:DNA-binding CsgD family transcriptional regulator
MSIGDFCRHLAPAISISEGPGMAAAVAARVVAALGAVVDFDRSVTFAYRARDTPIDVFDTFNARERRVFVTIYQRGPYLLDPFFRAASSGSQGFLRMRELAPDRFFSSEYFRNYYVQTGLDEEIGLFVPLGDGMVVVMSLMRLNQSGVFSAREVEALRAVEPLVSSLLVRMADGLARQFEGRVGPKAVRRQRLDRPSGDAGWAELRLTEREAAIVDLVLRGHSSESIAAQLGVACGTVKVHRRNVYQKLGIGSQAELLAIYLDRVLQRGA